MPLLPGKLRTQLFHKRFKKFVLYSVLELILIFVGITLSLEFSNWNDSRKRQKDELSILIELRTALQKDFTDVEGNAIGRQGARAACQQILQLRENATPYHDSLDITFARAFQSFGLNIQESAFENLKLKGFDLISNDSLRADIIQLYDVEFDHGRENGKVLHDLIFTTLVPFSARRFDTMNPNDRMKPVDYEKLLIDGEYRYYLNVIIFYNTFLLGADAALMTRIKDLVIELDKEITALQ